MASFNSLIVDSVVLKEPSSLDITSVDIVANKFTSELGNDVIDYIGFSKTTLSVTWENLNISELSTILSACTHKKSISVTYFNTELSAMYTESFTVSDRKSKTRKIKSTSNGRFSLSLEFYGMSPREVV